MYQAHNYEEMTPDKRPQDFCLDGTGWRFELSEHGGEYPDAMPQVITATDSEGRSCKYVPITVGGKVVDSKEFYFDSRSGRRIFPPAAQG
jgi:hypothetical protein